MSHPPERGSEDQLAEQRDFYRADAVQSDQWLSTSGTTDADARTHRVGRQGIADHLATIEPLGRVLEIAAGTGRLAEVWLPLADSAVLADSSPESLALAAERPRPLAHPRITMIEADIFAWDGGTRAFDTILFSAWLHHVPGDHFDRFWGAVDRLLVPGGVVIFDFLDAQVDSPGEVDIPDSPSDEYTLYAPVDGISARDLHGRRWHVVHELWRSHDLGRRLGENGWQLTVLGPGLLSNIRWATARR